MAKINVTIDTDDLFSIYEEDAGISPNRVLEKVVENAVRKIIKSEFNNQYSEQAMLEKSKIISMECIWQIEKKLADLINEDIVIQDRWGKPKFLGSVEDYIKKEIDLRMLRPVNSNGDPLEGVCTTKTDTWIEWHVKNNIEKRLKCIDRDIENLADRHARHTIDEKINNFKNAGLNELIMERLKAAGVK